MSDAFHSQFISSYHSNGNINEAPDLYYRYNKDLANVYNRNQNNKLISKVTTDDLCNLAHEQTLVITHVLDATFRRKPILIIVTSTNTSDSVVGPMVTKPCIYVFWHNILQETTSLIHFDLPTVGGVSLVALTSHPLTMVMNTVKEIENEEHLRHLLVFGKHDQSVQVALIHYADDGSGRVRGQVTQAELPSQVSGDITAIHVLTQDTHDRRLGFNDPRILVGTSSGYIQVLRFQAVFRRQNTKGGIHIVSAQTLTEFTAQHQEPITYLTCERVPGNRKIIAAVGQKSKSTASSTHLNDDNDQDDGNNENAHLYVIEWYGNHRRRISKRLKPSKLTSYSVSSTRIIPTETDFQITTIFQSTEDKNRFEVDVWSIEDRNPTQLISDEIVESDAKDSIDDMWPIQGTSRYMLLYPEKIIELTSTPTDEDSSKTQLLLTAPIDDEQTKKTISHSEVITLPAKQPLDDDSSKINNASSSNIPDDQVGDILDENKHQQPPHTERELTEESNDAADLDMDKDDEIDEHQRDSGSVTNDDIEANNTQDNNHLTEYTQHIAETTITPIDTAGLDLDKDDETDEHQRDSGSVTNDDIETINTQDNNHLTEYTQHITETTITPIDTTGLDLDKDDETDEHQRDSGSVTNDDIETINTQDNNHLTEYIQHIAETTITPIDTAYLDMDKDDETDEHQRDSGSVKNDDIETNNTQGNNHLTENILHITETTITPIDTADLDMDKEDEIDEHQQDNGSVTNDDIGTINTQDDNHLADYNPQVTETTITPTDTADLDEQQQSSGSVSNDTQENHQLTEDISKVAETTIDRIYNELEKEHIIITTTTSDNIDKTEADSQECDMKMDSDDEKVDGLQHTDRMVEDYTATTITSHVELEINDSNGLHCDIEEAMTPQQDDIAIDGGDIASALKDDATTEATDRLQNNVVSASTSILDNLGHDSEDKTDIQQDQTTINQQAMTFIKNGSEDNETVHPKNASIDDQHPKALIDIQQEKTIQADDRTLEVDVTSRDTLLMVNTFNIDDEADPSSPKESNEDYEPMIYDDDINNDISTSDQISIIEPLDSITTSTAPTSPDPSSLTPFQEDTVEEPPTPTMVYEAKVKKVVDISLSDGLNMVREGRSTDFSLQERLYIFFDVMFASSKTRGAETPTPPALFDIDKAIKTLEDLSLDDVEEDWLMGYCYNNKEHPLLRLFIMRYNIKHKRYRLVMMQHQTMCSEEKKQRHDPNTKTDRNNPKATLVARINRSCNNLAKLSQKMEPAILQDLPLDVFARPRGKVGNPFLNQQYPTLQKRKGLGFGAELIAQVLDRKRRRIL